MVEDQRSGGAGQRGEEPGARRQGRARARERPRGPGRPQRSTAGPHPRRSPKTRVTGRGRWRRWRRRMWPRIRAPGLRPACRAPRRSIPWTQATSDQTPPRRGAAVPAEVASRASQDSRHVSRRDRVGASSPEAERGLAETANEVPSATASAAAAPTPDSTEPSNSLAISSGSSRCQSAWATTGSQLRAPSRATARSAAPSSPAATARRSSTTSWASSEASRSATAQAASGSPVSTVPRTAASDGAGSAHPDEGVPRRPGASTATTSPTSARSRWAAIRGELEVDGHHGVRAGDPGERGLGPGGERVRRHGAVPRPLQGRHGPLGGVELVAVRAQDRRRPHQAVGHRVLAPRDDGQLLTRLGGRVAGPSAEHPDLTSRGHERCPGDGHGGRPQHGGRGPQPPALRAASAAPRRPRPVSRSGPSDSEARRTHRVDAGIRLRRRGQPSGQDLDGLGQGDRNR